MTETRKTGAGGDLGWWRHDRFGMFITWGLYALPGRHEWVQNRERLSVADYQKYFDHFDPDLFDPRDWARQAKRAGMRYFVITAKHHEGFCLWDSRHTDFKVTNTPFGRDILRETLDAFRAEGLRVGIYYSLLDWHHPDFTVDCFHPERDNRQECERNSTRDMRRYAEYMRNQVTELLTEYGPVDILWFDFSYTHMADGKGRADWESERLLELVRRLRPGIILDDRMDLPGAGDFVSPEQIVPVRSPHDGSGKPIAWEGCHTFSGSWGYNRDEMYWKSSRQFIGMLVKHVARGGNMLMTVGPTGRGNFDARAERALTVYANWMRLNARSIYGCTMAPPAWTEPALCHYTYNPDTRRLYVHVFDWPLLKLELPNLADKVEYAQLLGDASEVPFGNGTPKPEHFDPMAEEFAPTSCVLNLSVMQPPDEIPVIELFLKPSACVDGCGKGE